MCGDPQCNVPVDFEEMGECLEYTLTDYRTWLPRAVSEKKDVRNDLRVIVDDCNDIIKALDKEYGK